ncbi:hypothetical protein C7B65_24930 [Phormidesmis priestleyi ULC007]|uniref:Uncharacterized protein n=1 Tax=Phormidesmis priestleyi ULC007 TaxID=1920490 RepID=A0A2T1D491_9CYAN|nr:hypothetical protein [Phormidesmis priestleyi]PSB15234.1 hypothetical protein C7B65_24930 [Phormidesmis priestleyi ULC007]
MKLRLFCTFYIRLSVQALHCSFHPRASDPYKSLKTTLKVEIDEAAWESLYSDTPRPFTKPKSGRIRESEILFDGRQSLKAAIVFQDLQPDQSQVLSLFCYFNEREGAEVLSNCH